MKQSFRNNLRALNRIADRFDKLSLEKKHLLLRQLSKSRLPANKLLINYSKTLQFLCAHPGNQSQLIQAQRELRRLAAFLKTSRYRKSDELENSGLPYTRNISSFTYDCVKWLKTLPKLKIQIDGFQNASFDLDEILPLTLPSLEKAATTAGYENEELLDVLVSKKERQLDFLMSEFSKLEHSVYIRDHLFDGKGLYLKIISNDIHYSKPFNQISTDSPFFHSELLKHFDQKSLLKKKLPAPIRISAIEKTNYINAIKRSMALNHRETDPATYMDENSLRLYKLERGISIALYGMTPDRQLPLESYIGYTLFKNGFPAAYGGSWVFGRFALFGINIFEAYRGGESGYILCQLLRVYKQVFGIDYFEIEPYQYGEDNPEGITSGAFWFYYKYGFRPVEKRLLDLAKLELKKRKRTKNYRTTRKTLIKFTACNMAFHIEGHKPSNTSRITDKVTRLIQKKYKDNRLIAVSESISNFRSKTTVPNKLDRSEKQVLEEVSLWAEAMEVKDKNKLKLLGQMIETKPANPYAYQQILLKYLD